MLDITDRKRYEEELSRSEERFRLVARATGEAIWDNDLTTGEQEWDGATEALFGYAPRESRTDAWWEGRIHPEDKGRVLSGLEAVLRGGELWEDEYRFERADGSYATVMDRGLVVRDPSGEPVRMVGAMADVTERRRRELELAASEERFRTAFEAAAVGMAHVTPDGRWLRINDKLCEIAGRPREELLGMSYKDITPPEDRAVGAERVRRLVSGETSPYTVERRYVRKDDSRVWVSIAVSLVRGSAGVPDYLVCVVEDVTERKIGELVPDPLTPREAEVLKQIVAGRNNPQIAKDLAYGLGTVKLDVRNILAKLGFENAGKRRPGPSSWGSSARLSRTLQARSKSGYGFCPDDFYVHFVVAVAARTGQTAPT